MKNSILKYKRLIYCLLFTVHYSLLAQTTEIEKKKLELKQHSLIYRILNSIEIRANAHFGAGYFLSQFDPINPIYQPYALRDRFSLSISLNIARILDNSTYKIKQIELQELERKTQAQQKITEEKIRILNEKIKIQQQIVELSTIEFEQNKISIEKLLNEKMKLLDLMLQLKQTELETQ